MGRSASGSALRLLAFTAAISWSNAAFAQAAPPPAPVAPGGVAGPAGQPSPAGAVAPATPTAPPPLYPPPPTQPASPPAFLVPAERAPVPRREKKKEKDSAVERAPAFVDLTLTSYVLENRYSNFLNLGMRAGGFLFGRLKLAGRLIAPLAQVGDDWNTSSLGLFGSNSRVPSRQVSLIYGGEAGIVLSSTQTFVLAPGVSFLRADVPDYGTAVFALLPFEWITASNMRMNFEFGVGRGLGGKQLQACRMATGSSIVACPNTEADRPNGIAFFISFGMGYGF